MATADKPMLTPKPLQPQTSNVPDCVAQDRASTAMISGDAMARFVPATLGGVSSHSRQVYPGKIIAAYAVDGGWANLDVGGIIASVDLCTYITCKTPVEVGGHRACMAKTPDRYSLKFLFEKRIVLTMSAPKERTVLTMLASIDLTGLDRLAKSAK